MDRALDRSLDDILEDRKQVRWKPRAVTFRAAGPSNESDMERQDATVR